MQGLLRPYRWDWKDLRAELPGLAAAWLPDREEDLIGPGIAIDETAHIKAGDATACAAPQHAGRTGTGENCVTTVFSPYRTAPGQPWADFDVSQPDRGSPDPPRRHRARIPGQVVLSRRLVSRPDQYSFYLCWAAEGRPATMTYFITIAGRRWPAEETFKTAKDTLGWDQSQVRTWDGICRHTALAALAQLRCAAIRNALTGAIQPAPADARLPAGARDDP